MEKFEHLAMVAFLILRFGFGEVDDKPDFIAGQKYDT